VESIKESLKNAYGNDEVSIANAAVRWMVHHSQLNPRCGGIVYYLYSVFFDLYKVVPLQISVGQFTGK